MKAHIKLLQRALLKDVGARIAIHGFDKRPSGQTFYQKHSLGWNAFHLSFIPHGNSDFHVTGDVAVRFDEVEQLVHQDDALLSSAEKALTATLGAELGNIAAGQPIRLCVSRDEDVAHASAELVKLFEAIGLPYLTNHADYEKALAALRGNQAASWLHSPIHSDRCQKIVAIAWVASRREDLPTLVQECRSFLDARRDVGLAAFDRFVRRLLAAA